MVLLAAQAECATQLLAPCPSSPAAHYPKPKRVRLTGIPRHVPSMRNPCAGVPANPWCRGGGGYWPGRMRHVAAVVHRAFLPPRR